MNILLLGDMSAYHSNLATGLRNLGYAVDVASSGDSFKNFPRDIEYGPALSKKKRLNFIKRHINDYDLVQFITDEVLGIHAILKLFQMHHFGQIKPRLFMSTVGSDYAFWTKGRDVLNIPLFDEIEAHREKGIHNTWKHLVKSILMRSCVLGLIGCYEYHEAYKGSKKRTQPVVQPIDLDKLIYKEVDFSGKLLIYHGVQPGREAFKGSYHIMKAFETLNRKYPNDVSCIAKGGLPYEDYMQLVDDCHILFDQTNFISHGMNALNGMAVGKVVGCGSQDDVFWGRWQKILNIEKKPPLLPILPDPDQIVKQVEWILDNRDKLPEMAKEGRAYVEKYHDCKKVASMFLERWGVGSHE